MIDHGASLYFHHHWASAQSKVASSFERIRDHVLLSWAGDVEGASAVSHQRIDQAEIKRIVDLVPADWLTENNDVSAKEWRDRYVQFLTERLEKSAGFEAEVKIARTSSL